MKRYLIPLACIFPLALGSCGNLAPVDDVALCGAALMAANTTSPAVLFAVASSNPSCMRLAADALSQLLGNVAAQQRARGVR
jgi:hypothetical protein